MVSNPRTQNPKNGCLKISKVSKCLTLKPRAKALSYRASCLVKLTRQPSKREIPPYTCMEGSQKQDSCLKKSAKADAQ